MSFDGLFDDLEAHGTARFTLTGVKVRSDKDLVLIGTHAGHGNKGWMNAKRKLDALLKARVGAPSELELLELMIPMFAAHVITAWENVNESDGSPSKLSAPKLVELLMAITKKAPDIVNQALGHFTQPGNFRDTPAGVAENLGNG
jgi:hypothetical protein